MRQRISEQNKAIGNFPSKAFEKDGKYFVRFKNPVIIGAIKDIMILPPKQTTSIKRMEDELEAYSTKKKIIIEKIEQIKTDETLTDPQKVEQSEAYNQELIKVFKEESNNRIQGQEQTKHFKPKILRCRVIAQNEEGYYEIKPIKIPNSWKS
jgi:beta-lactamase regulating signal transducer with metallopeptidase domain